MLCVRRADVAWLLLLTLVEIKIVDLIHISTQTRIISAAHGVVIGTPHWRIYQNRLLGPWFVSLVSRLFYHGRFDRAYDGVTTVALLAANGLTYVLFVRLDQSRRRALGYAFAGMAAFVALQDQTWIFIWDYLDILIFTMFAYGVYSGRRWPYFLLLFVLELFNREAAFYICLWMILDGATAPRDPLQRRFKVDVGSLAVGVITLIGADLWTQWIRLRLFKHSEFAGVGTDTEHLHGNILNLQGNAADFSRFMTATTPALHFLDFLIIPVLLAYVWRNRHALSVRSVKMVVIIITMLAGIVLYAKIAETRVFLSLIPLVLFLHWDITREQKRLRRRGPQRTAAGWEAHRMNLKGPPGNLLV